MNAECHGSCENFRFLYRDPDVGVPDFALEGHVFKWLRVSRAVECHFECRDDCRCISFNFQENTDQENCQLSEANKHLAPQDMKCREKSFYYDLIREYEGKVRSPFTMT